MILLIDNYDSFVHNLARYFERLGQTTSVVRNDAIDVERVRRLAPDALVLSPGPCAPEQAGASLDLVRALHTEMPILGVCLGHQTIAAALGGRVVRAREPVHGRASDVFHAGRGVFESLPSPLRACRYHSLVVEEATLPDELEVTARTGDGVVMAIAHRKHCLMGLQFHPESILTEHGYELLAAFLAAAGLAEPKCRPAIADERSPAASRPLPTAPVTF
ncbi:MAG TPA: aminodeoxychorismate/anthranilate synthase component II [Pirellulales bacterium]|nr:aminodeoxychorismate/anthranilate synthase component II [Pirellulales bacterium]